jgi:hypothetical protein
MYIEIVWYLLPRGQGRSADTLDERDLGVGRSAHYSAALIAISFNTLL